MDARRSICIEHGESCLRIKTTIWPLINSNPNFSQHQCITISILTVMLQAIRNYYVVLLCECVIVRILLLFHPNIYGSGLSEVFHNSVRSI